jgi:proteasome lid subunit RPN8/RPN11
MRAGPPRPSPLSGPRALILPEAARGIILTHVCGALPEEACGLLSGRRDRRGFVTVASAHPVDNVAASNRGRRFEVDPAAHARLARHLRGSGLDIIGHYHSHPETGARPSAADQDSITDPSAVWVIAGLAERDRSSYHLTAWWVAEWTADTGHGRFKPLAILGQSSEDTQPAETGATDAEDAAAPHPSAPASEGDSAQP